MARGLGAWTSLHAAARRVARPMGQLLSICRGTVDELFPVRHQQELAEARDNGWRWESPEAYCHRCGMSCGPGATTQRGCSYCVGQRLPWRRVVRLGPYREPLDQWIRDMKFHEGWAWAPWFGAELAKAIGPESVGDNPRTAVCCVPLHWRRRWHRGYNQSELIARAMAEARGWTFPPLLRRLRHTRPQTQVPASERPSNVRGTFGIREVDLSGWNLWLVDDVKTSGATLSACARLLRQAGAQSVSVAVVAVAMGDSPSPDRPMETTNDKPATV